MKFNWKFWKKQSKTKGPPTRCRVVMDLPRDQVARGILVRIDEDGPEIVQEEGVALDRLGTSVEVCYDPSQLYSSYKSGLPWKIVFDVSFTWRGQSFGLEGPALVKECGLVFPNDRTPWASNVRIENDRVVLRARARPDAGEIVQVIQEAQRQVEELMRAYWFNKKAEAIQKPRKGAASSE